MARTLVTRRGRQVQIEGLEKLQANIADLMSRATGKEVKKIWMQAALILRDTAIEYAPMAKGPITHYEKGQPKRIIEPGALKAAIFAAYGKPDAPNVLVGVHFKPGNDLPGAPHAHWIEFGNSRIPAQPFMRPALSSSRSACVAAIADGYRTLLIERGSIPEPSSRNGNVPSPSVTQEQITRIRQRAAGIWAQKKAQGLVPGKHGAWITAEKRAQIAALRKKKS